MEYRYIYTQEEADDIPIKYKYWNECLEVGDWGLSDDGYVTELLRYYKYGRPSPDAEHNYGLWIFSSGIVTKYKKYGDKYPSRRPEKLIVADLLTGERKAIRVAEALKSDRAKSIMKAYLLNDKNIDKAVFSIIPSATGMELGKWRSVAKTEEFDRMTKDEVTNLLEGVGFSKQDVALLGKEIETLAKKKGDLTNLLRLWEKLVDIYGFNEKKVIKQTAELEHTQTQELLDKITKDEYKLTFTQEKDAEEPTEQEATEILQED